MYKAYFSPGEECLNAIVNNLKKAQKEVKICVFTISDNRISGVLEELFSKGIDVKIITDNKKIFDRGSDIFFLHKNGIPVKIDKTEAHMHHKFAVIDKEICILGSYNWTVSAQQENYEDIIVTDQRDITKDFLNEFENLWTKFVPVENH